MFNFVCTVHCEDIDERDCSQELHSAPRSWLGPLWACTIKANRRLRPILNNNMFSKLTSLSLLALISLAAATGTPPPPPSTPDSPQCCESVVPSTSNAASLVAAVVGLDLTGLNVPVGLSCSPITVGGNNCGDATVICNAPDEGWGGLIAINCIPITV
ncbi:Hydrophobin 2 [Mycena kentingensis (nom. inval.)]|nr:Hydrophobin 2 [Mycena kentingensis (nom. inval.)]